MVAGALVLVGASGGEDSEGTGTATSRGALIACNIEDGTEAWRHMTVDPPYNCPGVWSTPSLDLQANVVFANTGNVETGEKLAEFHTTGTITSAPVISDGWVFFGSGISYFTGTPGNTLYALSVE